MSASAGRCLLKSPLVPLLIGLALLGGSGGLYSQQRAIQRADTRDVAGLRAELDSVRALAARTPSGPDAERLRQSVATRASLLQRREYHVRRRQAVLDGWWRLSGPGTVLGLAGALLLTLALVARATPARSI